MNWEAIISGGIAGAITGIIGSYLTYLFNRRLEKNRQKKEIERKKSQLYDFAHEFFMYLIPGKERELCLLLERNVHYGSFFRTLKMNPVYRLSESRYVYGCKDLNWEFEVYHMDSLNIKSISVSLNYLQEDRTFSDLSLKYYTFTSYVLEKIKAFQLFNKQQIIQLESIVNSNFQSK